MEIEHQAYKDRDADQQVDKSRQDRRNREELTREIYLLDKCGVRLQAGNGAIERAGEKRPEQKGAVGEDGVGDIITGDFKQDREYEGEHQHEGQWLEHCPGYAQHRLLVAYLYFTDSQYVEQLTVAEKLFQAAKHFFRDLAPWWFGENLV